MGDSPNPDRRPAWVRAQTIAFAALLCCALVITGCSFSSNNPEYESYTKRCHDKGGVVSTAETGSWSASYKCIGDSGELLPRFGAAS